MPPNTPNQPNSAPAQFVPPPTSLSGIKSGSAKVPEQKKSPTSTQNALHISEIRDNLVIMTDGSMRSIIACQSINYDLMSEHEKESVEFAYQDFLNSLFFPIQIIIRSHKIDLAPYMEQLAKMRREQENMLLGVLMDDYAEFIDALSQETNIMAKDFILVVPYFPGGDVDSTQNSTKTFMSNMLAPQKQTKIHINEKSYNKGKDELKNRINTVVDGLRQMGIRAKGLNTKEISQMYYSFYNPDTAVREPVADFEELTMPVTTKAKGPRPVHTDDERPV